jgi:glycosyltransferase involved in cell wall biosynthesis
VLEVTSVPKVGVIIPSFNPGWSNAESLVSVFAQTYTDYGLIVVDHGSTHSSENNLQKYRQRIKYVKQ